MLDAFASNLDAMNERTCHSRSTHFDLRFFRPGGNGPGVVEAISPATAGRRRGPVGKSGTAHQVDAVALYCSYADRADGSQPVGRYFCFARLFQAN